MTSHIPPINGLRKNLVASGLGIFFALVILEICCQIYTLLLVSHWSEIKVDDDHYFRATPNDSLGYELASNVKIDKENRRLLINKHGIREVDNEIPAKPKVAILGDSVVFGNTLSQEQTISSLLENSINRAGQSTTILNFGVPGYAVRELAELLKIKNEIYDVDHVIYLLNPNDFTRRNSIYEGADSGLYRMYNRPLIKSVWFLRKAVYRLIKYQGLNDFRNNTASVRWYQWLFQGNKDTAFKHIENLAQYTKQKEIGFSIALLPAGVAYRKDGTFQLSEMYQDIGHFLRKRNITYIDPTDAFRINTMTYIDMTDHLTIEGNILMVEILEKLLRSKD